jgi:hypothetical protein
MEGNKTVKSALNVNLSPAFWLCLTFGFRKSSLRQLVLNTTRDILIYLLLTAATFLMLRTIAGHVTLEPNVGFLQFKQNYVHNPVWRTAFYIHVFTGVLTLLAGFTQFSGFILREHRSLHRAMGKFYVAMVLLINFPAGMLMAFYANGFWPTKLAFIILDSLWFWFTLKAYLEIRKGNIKTHKQFMIRSYALTFSAITLRTWKMVLSGLFVINPDTLYMIDAWLGFVPNWLFAEWVIRRKKNRNLPAGRQAGKE